LIEFIDREKGRFGVEPICRVLTAYDCKIAPSTYYARKTRPLSARAIQDALWQPILLALWTANYRVYGVHKLWKAADPSPPDASSTSVVVCQRANVPTCQRADDAGCSHGYSQRHSRRPEGPVDQA
jgi:putative transposase